MNVSAALITEPVDALNPFGLAVASVAVSLLNVKATPVPLLTIGFDKLMVALVAENPTTDVLGAMPVPLIVRPFKPASVPTVPVTWYELAVSVPVTAVAVTFTWEAKLPAVNWFVPKFILPNTFEEPITLIFADNNTSLLSATRKFGKLIVPDPEIVCIVLPAITITFVLAAGPLNDPSTVKLPKMAVCPLVCVAKLLPELMLRFPIR